MYRINTLPQSDWEGMGDFLGLGGPIVQELTKALEAGSGVDAGLPFAGGRALQYESLDNVLQTVTLTEEDATLWRAIPKRAIHATVDQFVRRTSYGDEWGIAVAESSNPAAHIAALQRAYTEVKYYRSLREVSDVSLLVRNIENPETEEEIAGSRQLVHRLDFDMYYADSAVIPTRINGLLSILNAGTYDMVAVDQAGYVLSGREDFESIVADVRNVGGRITHAFVNPLLQADFSAVYAAAERITIAPGAPGGQVYVGATIGGIETSQGRIEWEGDPFNRIGWKCPAQAQGDGPIAPATVTGAGGGTGGTIPTADYYYKVTAVNEDGESVGTATTAVGVVLGQVVTLTITQNAVATGYRIYRSAKDAGDATDCRFLWQGAYTDGSDSFVDTGYWVPGCAHCVMVDLRPQATCLQWSQLLPLSKKRLAEVGPTRPFLMNLYGAFRVAKPEWLAVLRNILPIKIRDAGWDPLGLYTT